jgi:hypothetical protein
VDPGLRQDDEEISVATTNWKQAAMSGLFFWRRASVDMPVLGYLPSTWMFHGW